MHDDLKQAFETLEEGGETETFDLGSFLPGFVEDMRVAHPGATVELGALPDDLLVVEASPEFPAALAELVANSVEHGRDTDGAATDGGTAAAAAPTVRIDAREGSDGRVEVTVADDGPGIPEMERAVVSGETAIDQLNHGQGIGLWFVKWVADLSGGSVAFDDDAEGAAVTVRLRRNRALG
jgi:signal transduction histidine kinase